MNDNFFIMGFCKAAEEHGVDPADLAKYAEESAGIGSAFDNRAEIDRNGDFAVGDKDSYIANLARNTEKKEISHEARKGLAETAGYLNDTFGGGVLSAENLAKARRYQANDYAYRLAPVGTYSSEDRKAIIQNLMDSGKENWKNYLESWSVPKRTAPNQEGLKNVPLRLEQLKKLREMQNSMVRNRGTSSVANVA